MKKLVLTCVVLLLFSACPGGSGDDALPTERDTVGGTGEVPESVVVDAREASAEAFDGEQDPPELAIEVPRNSGIEVDDFYYKPAEITIDGKIMSWINESGLAHTVTSKDGTFDSGEMRPGGRFSYSFSQKGTYDYFCKVHGESVMSGRVIVQ